MPFAMSSLLWIFTGFFLCVLVYTLGFSRGHPPFPPGPKGLPILGNLRDIPLHDESQTYYQWAKQHGPIISLHVFGQHIVIINTPELARELFEARSSIYSDRPPAPMLHLMGYAQWLIGLMKPSQQLRTCRHLIMRSFNPQTLPKWSAYHVQEVNRLLSKLLADPENFHRHVNRTFVGSFMMVLYGHRAPAHGEDKIVALHDKSVDEATLAITNGAYLVNLFPLLRYVPDWMSGAHFKREAKDALATSHQVLHTPVEIIKQEMAEGTNVLSFASSLLEEGEDELLIKKSAATAYHAGVGITSAILLSSILVMALFPEAQRRAQQEIDRIIGDGRLPELKDRSMLPYVDAFVKELFRWAPPGAIGLPHRATQDDVVQGFFIPAGSMIMCNLWGVLHDENRFSQPFDFIPERYLGKSDCPDPMAEVFGFGKRACPGRHLAEPLVWMTVASVLATFKIRKKVNADGKEIQPRVKFTSGIMRGPEPFLCDITPRSDAVVHLIRQANIDSL